MRTPPELPARIETRADLEALLARTTNWEERRPRRPTPDAFRLERVRDLYASVGDPQDGPAIVHVAGSKGKGTVVRMVEAALRAGGRMPVGRYTSPHLVDLSERIVVDGRSATDDELARAAHALLPHVRRHVDTPHAPTFFELLTAMAWVIFRDRGCTEVVLETGLGGRLDATNVCRPALTILTAIEREHTEFLGDTIEEIAAEKAGILKADVPAATCASGAALDVIRERAATLEIPLAVVGEELRIERAVTGPGPRTEVDLAFAPTGRAIPLVLGVAGAHHAPNAALAAWAALRRGVEERTVVAALRGVTLPGIVEPLGGDPLVIADGAHTLASAEATRGAVESCWPGRRRVLLVAMLAGKDADAIAARLAPGASAAVVTTLPTPRALDPEEVAGALRTHGVPDVSVAVEIPDALARARAQAGPGGVVLATGSVRLAGAVRRLVLPS